MFFLQYFWHFKHLLQSFCYNTLKHCLYKIFFNWKIAFKKQNYKNKFIIVLRRQVPKFSYVFILKLRYVFIFQSFLMPLFVEVLLYNSISANVYAFLLLITFNGMHFVLLKYEFIQLFEPKITRKIFVREKYSCCEKVNE